MNEVNYPKNMYVKINSKEDFSKSIRFALKHIPTRIDSGQHLSKYWAKQHYSDLVNFVVFDWNNKFKSYVITMRTNMTESEITYTCINDILDKVLD